MRAGAAWNTKTGASRATRLKALAKLKPMVRRRDDRGERVMG
jgi:hypothetical protein